ncbi:MAG: MFS transporter [Candidatus Competibacteraceae bacterium]
MKISAPTRCHVDAAAQTRIPLAIWALGVVSLLMDISSELIHSLLPVFLVNSLGVSAFTVGWIEGAGESLALLIKVFSGPLSDWLGQRKGLAVVGYGLGALSKPLFAVATNASLVLSARLLDRAGKGLRGAPRDALVADLAPPAIRGAAYGLRQALDTVGAFTGPLLAVALMWRWANDVRAVFWVAVVPGLLSVAVLLFGVQEPQPSKPAQRVNPLRWRELKGLGEGYGWVAAVGAVFTLARFSEAFLILRASQAGLPSAAVPLVLVAMNVVYALSAYPLGSLSDTVSHTNLLAVGLSVLVVADLVLATAGESWWWVFLGVGLWGLHLGATQGLLAALVADAAPAEWRGTAFGVFNLLSGLAMLFASALAGWLWDRFGPEFTFSAGALFGGLALVGITRLPAVRLGRTSVPQVERD